MKRKILIFLFILSISLCLAFISSASEYDFISSYDFDASLEVDEFGTYMIKEVTVSNENESYSLRMFVIEGYGPQVPNCNSAYVIQPHAFKRFVDVFVGTNGDCTYEKFIYKLLVTNDKLIEIFGYPNWDYFFADWIRGHNDLDGDTTYLTESYFNKLYFYNDKLTYSEGYAQGVQSFKESDMYKDTLSLERETGQAEGKDSYLASEEYKTALKTEYNAGYDDGLNDLEESKNKTNFVAILGTCGIGVLVLAVVYFITSKKKRKRR